MDSNKSKFLRLLQLREQLLFRLHFQESFGEDLDRRIAVSKSRLGVDLQMPEKETAYQDGKLSEGWFM